MSWRIRRQLSILGGMFIVLCVLGIFVYKAFFVHPPTCFDGTKNGAETGVDCGGSCDLMCKDEMRDPDILWVRSFALSGSQVNAIAFIENRNPTAILKSIDYTFYIYDEKNILIATRTGATVVAPNSQFYIFEHGIDTGNKLPARTLLVFGEIKNPWVKFPFARTRDLDMRISDQKNIYGDTPRVRAILENKSLLPLRNISVRVIVFDAKGNAIGASTTKIPMLKEKSQTPLVFTWPRAFTADAVRTEIVPFINPFEQEYE